MRIHRDNIVDVLRSAWGVRALEMVKTRVKPARRGRDSDRWEWIERQLTPPPTKAEIVARATRILAMYSIDINAIL